MAEELKKNFVYPNFIPEIDCPLIVLSDDTSGIFEFFIKWRHKAPYNHIMWMHRPGFFASQGNTYSEAPLKRYMKPTNRLKFWKIKNLTPVQRKLILASIQKKLNLPWWKTTYDRLGIIGQATGVKFINNPWREYCSEDVPHHLKNVEKSLPDGLAEIVRSIPDHAYPYQIDRILEKFPDYFEVYGYWQGD